VYYSAAGLGGESYSRLLDAIFTEAGVARPVRVRGGHVEARFARLGERRLLYVVNGEREAAKLSVESASGTFRSLRELRDGVTTPGPTIRIPARQTCIYELRQ
jgi:hypothetical protein